MDFKFGNLIFSSNFDSGNLSSVEKVSACEENCNNPYVSQSDNIKVDYEFNVWTKPDCMGTEFENINRTWFYFSVKGYLPDRTMKITIKNLNRQHSLYAQGYCPLFKTDTNNPEIDKWFRIRSRPTWASDVSNFKLTFTHRLSELKDSITFFAFCYPWSYTECQRQLEDFDYKFNVIDSYSCKMLSKLDPRTIYYKRELITRSLDGRRIDLITITDLNGVCSEREETFDEKLFPEKRKRPWKFKDKRVFVVTSRVHPGETPSSHVFNGFLNFILRPDDPRSIQLRKQFIFKLIPLLNPDGVFRGHYRTDSRGVNLNRVYLNPDIKLHSSIYAAKSLLVYHHIFNSLDSDEKIASIKSCVFKNIKLNIVADEIVSSKSPNVFLDPRRSEMSIFRRKVLEVKDVLTSIIPQFATNVIVENSKSEFKSSDISATVTYEFDTYLEKNGVGGIPKNKNDLEDYYEVIVDTDSLKCDPPRPNETTKVSAAPSPELIKSIVDPRKNTQRQRPHQRTLFVDDANDNQAQNQSIYRFVKPSNRSNSTIALNDQIYHKWNLKGNTVDLVNQSKFKSSQINIPTGKFRRNYAPSFIPVPVVTVKVLQRDSAKIGNKSTLDSLQLSDLQSCDDLMVESRIGNEGSDDNTDKDCGGLPLSSAKDSLHLSEPCLLEISSDNSGIAFYVDLHGHCSKRGCFMYGNCLEAEEQMIDNLLYPKLISLNSAHFDFLGCNFSQKNMYVKDAKDGTSKEGAGRVATWKHLGLVHCYTLECNYNTGRMINTIPATSKDDGRASPPSLETTCLLPPKYTPFHFEDVGKAVAIAALDMCQTNPWSRLVNSEYSNLRNIRDYIKSFITGQKGGSRRAISLNRRFNRTKRQQSTTSVSVMSKTGSTSLNTTRKSQSFMAPNLTNSEIKVIKSLASTGLVTLSQQTNDQEEKVTLEINYDNLKNNNTNFTSKFNPRAAATMAQYCRMIKDENLKSSKEKPKLKCHYLSNQQLPACSYTLPMQEVPQLIMTHKRQVADNNCYYEVLNFNQLNNNSAHNYLRTNQTIRDDKCSRELHQSEIDEVVETKSEDLYKNINFQSFIFDQWSSDFKRSQ